MKRLFRSSFVLVCVAAGILMSGGAAHAILPPYAPCIDVEKNCTDAASPLSPIPFNGYVRNCGNVDLLVRVLDMTTRTVLINNVTLAPGASAPFSGSYSPAQCGPSTNTVKALGYVMVGGSPVAGVYDIDSATCAVPCDSDDGCTRTPGYWKTHSGYGPAPYDETWAQIGEDTIFFLSGQSYYEVLWTEPSKGNAYYILAHAFIAAKLNILGGASAPAEVQAALATATALFQVNTPSTIEGLKGSDSLRLEFLKLAGLLDDYNNGLTGPGHCDGDNGGVCP